MYASILAVLNSIPIIDTLQLQLWNLGKNRYSEIYIPVNAIVRLPHPRSGDSQGQQTFLAPSADKQTHNYDTECSNHPINPKVKGIEP